MAYKLYGSDIEGNVVVVDNTSGETVTLFNFSNKYKGNIGPSIYSSTKIGYSINNVDLGIKLSPLITIYDTVGTVNPVLKQTTRKILCICLGGGAGGTGGNFTTGSSENGGGGGGGGGGGLAWVIYKVNGGENLTITVGAGGIGGIVGDPTGSPGTAGGNTTLKIETDSICTGYGGLPGVRSTAKLLPGTSGPDVSGVVINNTNVINSGTVTGLVGGNGQQDKNSGQRTQNGYGGAGGNGGTTVYTYGKGTAQITNTTFLYDSTETIVPLSFTGGDFLRSDTILDPKYSSFLYADFCGTQANSGSLDSTNYGRGGSGGNGEGNVPGATEPGYDGKRGFCVIAEYGFE